MPTRCSATTGIAPVTEASGNSEWMHFVLPAQVSAPDLSRACGVVDHPLEWAHAYYDHQRKGIMWWVRSLAFKWIRIIFRCWKDGKPYDEEIYMTLSAPA